MQIKAESKVKMMIPAVNGIGMEGNGTFKLPSEFCIDNGFAGVDRVFMERLGRIGSFRLNNRTGRPVIAFIKDERMLSEAYSMQIFSDRVEIRAKDEKGYGFALVTFYQLLVQGNGEVKECRIQDAPRWHYRGLMLDSCRHFYEVEEVKKIIEQASLLKMNAFHWHLSDDQGFRIESRKFPRLNTVGSFRRLSPQDPMVEEGLANPLDRYGGYYTQDEIRDVVAFAAERGMDVIPEIDLPGHSSAILAAYPEFTCSGKPLKVKNTFGVHPRIFCAGKEKTYSFLEELLDEVVPLFPSPYFHLGGDEAPKSEWHDCPDCNRMRAEHGLKNYEELQAYFTGRLVEHIKGKGKIPIVWNESAASGKLDSSAVVQYWSEMAPGASYMIPEIRKGRKMILSDGDRLYISSGYAEMPMKSTLLYEPNVKGTPVPDSCVLGIEAPVWTEWVCTNQELERRIYPRLLAVAELGWTKEKDADEFYHRAQSYLKCRSLNLLEETPWEEATIHGDAAVREVVKSLLQMGTRYGSMTTGEEDEESGLVQAVTPDDPSKAGELDPEAMTRIYITNKMQASYTPEEIGKAIHMVLQVMSRNGKGGN